MSTLPAGSGAQLLLALYALLAVSAAGHALLTKQDPRAAWGWIAVCWLFPLAGAVLYYLFGINHVQRRARRFFGPGAASGAPETLDDPPPLPGVPEQELRELLRIGRAMAGRPLVPGNAVEPKRNGEEAYPEMLAAIAGARRTVWLASYIFENKGVARDFVEALAAAHRRGVDVRVIVDGLADLYWWPRASALLADRGVPVARFLPPRLFPPMLHLNLRNHRKLLVVDGTVAFTGGMNIGDHHIVRRWRKEGVADLHFRVEGPVVRQLAAAFRDDWRSATGFRLPADAAPAPGARGPAACRVITDGPNDHVDRLVLILLGALASAHTRVRILTPYFLPPPQLAGALQSAAMRGVQVQVLIPERSDLPWVDWAARHPLRELLRHDVRVRLRPRPFAHSKLFLVDDYYVQVGSANVDARSLFLNFELMTEIYDRDLARRLHGHFDALWEAGEDVTAADLRDRSLPRRLRDAFFWLFSPYF